LETPITEQALLFIFLASVFQFTSFVLQTFSWDDDQVTEEVGIMKRKSARTGRLLLSFPLPNPLSVTLSITVLSFF